MSFENMFLYSTVFFAEQNFIINGCKKAIRFYDIYHKIKYIVYSYSCIVHVIVLYFVLVLYSDIVLYLFFYCTVYAYVARDITLAEVFPCFFLSCKANARV
jgi:hypothetical protein